MSSSDTLNIVFAGTPEFAAKHLEALLSSRHRVVCVYTQPDRPAGRGKKLHASPVKQLALEKEIEIQQPPSLKDQDAQSTLKRYNADLMIVVAYGLLLPKAVLLTPKLGCINVHASLLPRWRGAAPIQRCIEAGDTETGITIMQMDEGLDTGDMLVKSACPILADDTAGSLHDRLAHSGPSTLIDALDLITTQSITPEKQNNDLATYAHKLTKQEAEINWRSSARSIELRIRAFNPFPTATTILAGERLRIHKASIVDTPEAVEAGKHAPPGTLLRQGHNIWVVCGDQATLNIERLQLPGKKALSNQEILNGSSDKFQQGFVFGPENQISAKQL